MSALNDTSASDPHAACRKATARAWSAFLDVAMSERLEDGTPVLDVVFAHNPDLRDRLAAALVRPSVAPAAQPEDDHATGAEPVHEDTDLPALLVPVEEYQEALGEAIRAARKRNRLKQAELAHLAGLTLSTFQRIESGTYGTTTEKVAKIAWALGMSGGDLFRTAEEELVAATRPRSDSGEGDAPDSDA